MPRRRYRNALGRARWPAARVGGPAPAAAGAAESHQNSERALEAAEEKSIAVSARANGKGVTIRVADSGPGIASPDGLFQPFQKGAEATGLGLYLSRAFVRSFRGELRHEPGAGGCVFAIELAAAGDPQERTQAEEHGTHPTLAGR